MPFDDTNASGDPVDLSRFANNVSLINGTFIDGSGNFGDGITFDGVDDFAENAVVSIGEAYHISLWLNPSNTIVPEGTGGIYMQLVNTDNNFFVLGSSAGALDNETFAIGAEGAQTAVTNISLAGGVWHKIDFDWNGTAYDIYLNAVKQNTSVSTGSGAGLFNITTLCFGKRCSLNDLPYNGSLDEILIFNRSLSSAEIGALYNASVNQYQNNFTSLSEGAHTFRAYAVDGEGNRNQTELRTVNVDITVPSVFDLVPTAGTNFNVTDVIEIGANVTDNIAVGTVLANVTLPNGTVEQLTLSNTGDFYNNSFTIPTLIGQYNITFIANDTSGNVNSTQTSFFVGVDVTAPSVFNLIPTSGTSFNVSDTIEIGADVTDNVAVGTVLANITLPNGTIQQLSLGNSIGDKYNNSFTIPFLTGQYNITFIANDTSGNINSTETTFFVGFDVVAPSVFDLVPVANSNFNVSDVIEIGANVTDNVAVGTVLANVTLPNGTVEQLTLSNTGDFYNNSFTIPALLGQYNVTFIANDTSGNVNSTETTFFVGVDTIPPSVFDLVPTAGTNFNVSDVIEIGANVTDIFGVDTVLANVTLPNGTVNQLILTNLSVNKYNNSFAIPALTGQYTITFIANDTSGNVNSTETTFFVGNFQNHQ